MGGACIGHLLGTSSDGGGQTARDSVGPHARVM